MTITVAAVDAASPSLAVAVASMLDQARVNVVNAVNACIITAEALRRGFNGLARITSR